MLDGGGECSMGEKNKGDISNNINNKVKCFLKSLCYTWKDILRCNNN